MAEFKESEHPRDKDGKFTDKGAARKSVIQRLRERHTARKRKHLNERLKMLIKKRQMSRIGLQFFAEKALKTQPSNKIVKGMRKLERRIEEHKHKIANPSELYPNWDAMPDIEKQGIIYGWEKEIKNFQSGINDRIAELSERGEKYEK